MKNIIKNPSDINRIEFWAATTMFVFSVFFLVSGAINNNWEPGKYEFDEAHQHYSYFNNHFLPMLSRYISFYASYCLLTFVISTSPKQKRKHHTEYHLHIDNILPDQCRTCHYRYLDSGISFR
jgi:two-component system LytT family sensor kinase